MTPAPCSPAEAARWSRRMCHGPAHPDTGRPAWWGTVQVIRLARSRHVGPKNVYTVGDHTVRPRHHRPGDVLLGVRGWTHAPTGIAISGDGYHVCRACNRNGMRWSNLHRQPNERGWTWPEDGIYRQPHRPLLWARHRFRGVSDEALSDLVGLIGRVPSEISWERLDHLIGLWMVAHEATEHENIPVLCCFGHRIPLTRCWRLPPTR